VPVALIYWIRVLSTNYPQNCFVAEAISHLVTHIKSYVILLILSICHTVYNGQNKIKRRQVVASSNMGVRIRLSTDSPTVCSVGYNCSQLHIHTQRCLPSTSAASNIDDAAFIKINATSRKQFRRRFDHVRFVRYTDS